MTLAQIADFVTQKVGKTDEESVAICKDFIRRRYQMIYDSTLWKDSMVMVALEVETEEVILPNYVERVVGLRSGTNAIFPNRPETLFQMDPNTFDRIGTPWTYSELPPVAVHTVPANDPLTLVSSDAGDVGKTVIIRGMSNGLEEVENVSLNGTTPVVTTKSWDAPFQLSKETTAGTVTVKDSSNVEVQKLLPSENERKHSRLFLHDIPGETTTLLVLAKRRMTPLDNDLDTPILRNIDNAIIAYAMSDMLERSRQYAKAQAKAGEGQAHILAMRDLETNQGADCIRIIPEAYDPAPATNYWD